MATIRLIPSTYYLSNSSYLTVTNASNMYANTDSTDYATVYNNRSSTSSYYIYLRGFNFNSVPANAIINSFTVKFKAYESGVSTSTSYRPYLCHGTTTLTGSCNVITASTQTLTFTGVTADWDEISGYGDDFGIRINCRRNARNTAGYVYIYGAEILVDYTLPVYHTVTASSSNVDIDPSGAVSVLEGSSYSLLINGSDVTVTDNNVDVTDQLVEVHSASKGLVPDGTSGRSNFTISNESNAYAGADNDTYAQLTLAAGGTTGVIYFDLEALSLPSGSTIQSVSAAATLQYNRNGSSSGFTASCQMYSGNTAKGSSTSIVSAGGTDVAKTTFNLSVGSWTASELANARLHITATNNASGTSRYLYVYGVTLTVTYSISGTVYRYTISSVMADHTIVVTAAVITTPPTITIQTPDKSVISSISGYSRCTCLFTADQALSRWEARATLQGVTPARGVGLLVESGTTLAQGANGSVYVDAAELTNGDGQYTISIYGRNNSGYWSDGSYDGG